MLKFRKQPLSQAQLKAFLSRCKQVLTDLEAFQDLLPNNVQKFIAIVATQLYMSGKKDAGSRR